MIRPDAVLFDMDGTLVDRESMMSRALAGALAAAGSPLDGEEVLRLGLGRSWVDVHADLDVAARTGWDVAEMVARANRVAAEAGEVAPVLRGAVELVEALAAVGVPVAVVSGSLRAEVLETVEAMGVAHLLALAHGAEDYPAGKPDPSGYLGAAAVLGVAPARTVVVEDSIVGVAAGLAAGMRVIGTTDAHTAPGTAGQQDLSAAHLVVAHLGEVTLEVLATLVAAR